MTTSPIRVARPEGRSEIAHRAGGASVTWSESLALDLQQKEVLA
jgi:hypothetical protein